MRVRVLAKLLEQHLERDSLELRDHPQAANHEDPTIITP